MKTLVKVAFLTVACLPKSVSLQRHHGFCRSNRIVRSCLHCGEGATQQANQLKWQYPLKVSDAYQVIMKQFESSLVPEADISARILISDVTKIGYRMSDFNRNQEFQLTESQSVQLEEFCRLRIERTPLQYIIGNWDFYGLTIKCRPPVLIPRPETEELVDYVLSSKILDSISQPKILDIGAGTGAIGIALLSKLKGATCDAIDINPIAVELANENAADILKQPATLFVNAVAAASASSSSKSIEEVPQQNNKSSRYNCELISFLDFVKSGRKREKYDVIVSNPPYIPADEMLELEPEVAQFEDHRALYGGDDGLSMVRDIIIHSKQLLRPDGPGEIWMEVARRHPKAIEELMKKRNTKSNKEEGTEKETENKEDIYGVDFDFVESIHDLSGNPRFVRLRLKPSASSLSS